MKKQILSKLSKIQKLAEQTGMEGKLSIEFTGCSVYDWDLVIESISEFPRHNHIVQVTPNLTVTLLLG